MSKFQHHTKPDLTEEDIARALQIARDLPSAVGELWATDVDAAFKAFAKEMVALVDKGILSPMEVCYCIAGFYLQIEETEDDVTIGVGELACELESPESVVGRPVEPEWNKILTLLAS